MGRRGKQLFATGNWKVAYKETGNLATRTINFIQALPTTGGKPAKLMGWQQKFIRSLLKENKGKRAVRNALLSCGRKNGKSGLGSYLMLAHLCCPALQQRGSRLYSVANDRAQAALIFDELEGIISQCPILLEQVTIKKVGKIIEHDNLNIKYQAMTSDSHRLQGLRPYFAIVDELGVAKSPSVYEAMRTAFGAMEEGLLLVMSTQASHDEHVMSELYDHAVKVRDGIIKDDSFLPAIYSAPKDCRLDDPQAWRAANPSLGKIRNLQELKTSAARVLAIPNQEPSFRNLILNQRVAATGEVWLSPEQWQACKANYTAEDLHGERCVLGLDMSSVADLTSLHAYFPDTHHTLHWCWSPRKTVDKGGNVPYRVWASNGLLSVADGEAINSLDVLTKVAELHKNFDVIALGYDRWRLERLESDLDVIGLQTELVPVGLGYKTMSPAVAELEDLVINRKLKHQANPLVQWNLTNVVLDTDASGNRKPNKSRAQDKIDCIVSLLIAIAATPTTATDLPTLTAL